MSLERELKKRADHKCELCSNDEHLQVYTLAPAKEESLDKSLLACKTCVGQIEDKETTDVNHWRCLNDSMWSEHQAVQVAAWRMLSRLRNEGWPQDLLDMMYMEDEVLEFAKATGEGEADPEKLIHRDVNGVVLQVGDSVVLIKDLKVKGSSMIAKQGTAVRNIRLDHENEKYIEGKVGPTLTVIITDYVKKI
ncbi:PhnA domain-containing protein [Ichthyenterobacterium magnum]|uniref:Phosphonoacetate hydrolase n=1 Tax=Ichthyenterobacterium magnum TaxID=1230530 RepID=A0A420DW63_9FLAO|nr:alkylphosphonate utilization protein [Ichthyenterobacterium magnum]RKE98455.1 phosphonoacetate hydrolase [Ichthyenterobacterium magnum]